MEERSPGSYRINIRGSSLRSPFGVRNVKVYYNDIPFTDPGGQTYLNGLGYYNFNSLEIIKGPGSSLYGAGTGGVLLIESMNPNEQKTIFSELTAGSYGLRNLNVSVATNTKEAINQIGFQHQESEGYRSQSSLNKNVFSWNGRYTFNDQQSLKTTFLYSDLFYETPGALTKAEYEANPGSARPRAGPSPGAEESRAAIKQKMFLAGISFTQHFSLALSNTSTAYGMFTQFQNPNIRNYSKNNEPHVGGRTVFRWSKESLPKKFSFIFGGELQQGFASVNVYKNKAGDADTLRSADDIYIRQSLIFAQATFELKGWEVNAGTSLNNLNVELKRSVPFPIPAQIRKFSNELAPRIAWSKKWKTIILYSSIAKGFSPPSSSELSPSGSAINLELNAEKGTNYDLGLRGIILKDLHFDVNAFLFSLSNTIVQRRDASGGDYYINSGSTKQHGIETAISYPILKRSQIFKQSAVWLSHTWHQFKYKEFKQLSADYSGKKLPGEAPHTIAAGIDVNAANGISASINYYFSGRIPLNDANTEYANEYHLLNTKISFQKQLNTLQTRIIFGAENLLNQHYSLGNDLNAFGGRFYNAAPQRNYYVSVAISFNRKNKSTSL
jgi:iron complex outermembrane receptor protein